MFGSQTLGIPVYFGTGSTPDMYTDPTGQTSGFTSNDASAKTVGSTSSSTFGDNYYDDDTAYASSAKGVNLDTLHYLGLGTKTDAQTNYVMQKDAQNYNSEEAQLNRTWQEYMSNTSYQRMVKDLMASGLNPALAYQNGGASTPSGYSAHTSALPGGSRSLISGMFNNLLNTAISVAGYSFGRSLGSKLASSSSSAKMANTLDKKLSRENTIIEARLENSKRGNYEPIGKKWSSYFDKEWQEFINSVEN